MLKMIKGCTVPNPSKLSEGYELKDGGILMNIGADRIKLLMESFLNMHDGPFSLILEIPTNKQDEYSENFHKDVYYLDYLSKKEALLILERYGNVLIHDGLGRFGFCLYKNGEIFLDKYNVMMIYTEDSTDYEKILEGLKIPKVEKLITAWDTFSNKNRGISETYREGHLTIYTIVEELKKKGLYFAERRED